MSPRHPGRAVVVLLSATTMLATATGAAIAAFRDTTAVAVVARAAPTFPLTVQRVPHIDDSPYAGAVLTAVPGEWSGIAATATRAYQWYGCTGGSCAPIPSATSPTYAVPDGTDGAVGTTSTRTFAVRETVASDGVSASASSIPTRPERRGGVSGSTLLGRVDVLAVTTAVPAMPSIARAVPRAGSATAVSVGTWSDRQLRVLPALTSVVPLTGEPTYAYRWLRCGRVGNTASATIDGTAGCSDIDGATNAAYTPTADDVGQRLRVAVTRTSGAPTLALSLSLLGISASTTERVVTSVVTQASEVVQP
jgi:hypothetical protein